MNSTLPLVLLGLCLLNLPAADLPPVENGLSCRLVIPTPIKIVNGMLPVQLVFKNVSTTPLKICSLNMNWRSSSDNGSEVRLNPLNWKSDAPIDGVVRSVVVLGPGATLILNAKCVIPKNDPFRLTVGYEIDADSPQFPGLARKLHLWQGAIQATPVMVQLKPVFKISPIDERVPLPPVD